VTGKTEDEGFAKCCKAGAARMLLHLGQLVEAKALFQELDNPELLQSCAEILEAKKLLNVNLFLQLSLYEMSKQRTSRKLQACMKRVV